VALGVELDANRRGGGDGRMQALGDVDLAVSGGRVVIPGRTKADPEPSAFALVGTAKNP
jgi:hypothetical protein